MFYKFLVLHQLLGHEHRLSCHETWHNVFRFSKYSTTYCKTFLLHSVSAVTRAGYLPRAQRSMGAERAPGFFICSRKWLNSIRNLSAYLKNLFWRRNTYLRHCFQQLTLFQEKCVKLYFFSQLTHSYIYINNNK